MTYQRKINDEQAKKVEDIMRNGMNVLVENGIMLSVQVDTIKDILIEKKLVTLKEFEERSMDKVYTVLSATESI